jgi:hypothetical protein
MDARVERWRTKRQQMEGTELTLIQDIVVLVECYVQDLMQKKGLLLFKRRGTQRHYLWLTPLKVSAAQYNALRSYISAVFDVTEDERISSHL